MSSKSFIAYIIGPTNVGKSTLLDLAAKYSDVGVVEVGRYMRAKYPPSHFKGQNNPTHLAHEAWQVYCDQLKANEDAGKILILVDGQPRDTKQTIDIINDSERHSRRVFVHMWAPTEVLAARSQGRDGGDPEKLALNTARLVSDMPSTYNVLSRLLGAGRLAPLVHVDTSLEEYTPEKLFNSLYTTAEHHVD